MKIIFDFRSQVDDILSMKDNTFTPAQLDQLREGMAKVTHVDPDSSTLASLRLSVVSWNRAMLHQVADAGIKWLSYLSKKQLENLDSQEWRSFRGTPEGKAFLAAREHAKDFGK